MALGKNLHDTGSNHSPMLSGQEAGRRSRGWGADDPAKIEQNEPEIFAQIQKALALDKIIPTIPIRPQLKNGRRR